MPCEKIAGKEENAGKQHFLPFRQCFLSYQWQIQSFEAHLDCHLQMLQTWTSVYHNYVVDVKYTLKILNSLQNNKFYTCPN